jgi:hypothetical protein
MFNREYSTAHVLQLMSIRRNRARQIPSGEGPVQSIRTLADATEMLAEQRMKVE